tara:strand:+ start:85 stop:384 length:300 start_codon:yes stop_codon:yes gene_type:complete
MNKYNTGETMRANDLIRAVLDILDGAEEIDKDDIPNEPGEKTSRFKQIFAMLNNPSDGPLANSPNEIVSDIDSVTTDAGGGVNSSKDPADIRVKDPRGY